jgi:rod shape-determining protein MreD
MRAMRLALLIGLLVVVQVSVFPHLQIAGVAPDLGLIVAIAVGVLLGPEAGALAGFGAGLGYDLFLETPLGLNALAYALVGYAVGVLTGGLMRAPRYLPIVLVLVGALAGGLLVIGIGVLAGVESVKGLQGVQTVGIAALYDALLAPVVFLLVAVAIRGGDRAGTTWPPAPTRMP